MRLQLAQATPSVLCRRAVLRQTGIEDRQIRHWAHFAEQVSQHRLKLRASEGPWNGKLIRSGASLRLVR